MLSINRFSIKKGSSSLQRMQCNLLKSKRAVSDLIRRIDDQDRADNVALVNSYQGEQMTYGYLSKESKRIADILDKRLDPSVKSIGECLVSE